MPSKTREQKERAAQRRAKGVGVNSTSSVSGTGISYSFSSIGSSKTPIVSPLITPQQRAKATEFSSYFKHDMLKTLVVCLIIAVLIALIWWRLR